MLNKLALSNNGAGVVKSGSLDGRDDSEHPGDDFVEVSKIFAMPDAIIFATESLDQA